jgi:hypothetical protein
MTATRLRRNREPRRVLSGLSAQFSRRLHGVVWYDAASLCANRDTERLIVR